ncbi:uncharacterized protein LOC135138882 [Zophobas morio]|uniref:uncharacterized protein LOC135138882 n=1 Tax=Zophobas morio TaxID=2755281 RepID=UPI00308298C3
MKTVLVSILVFLSVSSASKLPQSFKKCDKQKPDFEQCLGSAIRDAIKQLDKPVPEYGLPNLEPLALPQGITIGNATTGVRQKYSNVGIYGHTEITNVKARMDFDKDILNLECSFPEIRHEADYEALGAVLLLPIDSKGKVVVTYKKPIFTLTFNLEKHQKENRQFYKIIKTDFDVKLDKVVFQYTNLFENSVLTDNFNAQMNVKWDSIFSHLKVKYLGLYSKLYGTPFGNLLEKVAISDIFDGI